MAIYTASTPTQTITLPFDTELIADMSVTYTQENMAQTPHVVLRLSMDEVDLDGNDVIISLTQEQTKKFEKGFAFVQVRALDVNGKIQIHDPVMFEVKKSYDETILGNTIITGE